MSGHWDMCRSKILGYADFLSDAIKAKRLNPAAADGLIWAYLDRPAYYPEWKSELFAIAYERIVGHRPEQEDPSPPRKDEP